MRTAALVLCGVGLSVLPACQRAHSPMALHDDNISAGAFDASPVEIETTTNDGRPESFKKLQTWLNVQGLTFTGDGVTIDKAAEATIRAQRDLASPADSLARSAELLEINAVVRAIGAARDAVLQDPGSALAYHALGTALRAKRKDDKALDAFTTAARLDPDSSAIQADLGDARNRMGDLPGAISAYTRAVELNPSAGPAHSRLAVLHYYAGDDDAAWSSLRRADTLGAAVPPQFRVLLAQRTPQG